MSRIPRGSARVLTGCGLMNRIEGTRWCGRRVLPSTLIVRRSHLALPIISATFGKTPPTRSCPAWSGSRWCEAGRRGSRRSDRNWKVEDIGSEPEIEIENSSNSSTLLWSRAGDNGMRAGYILSFGGQGILDVPARHALRGALRSEDRRGAASSRGGVEEGGGTMSILGLFRRLLGQRRRAAGGGVGFPIGFPAVQIAVGQAVTVGDLQGMLSTIQHYSEPKLQAGFALLVQDARVHRSLFQGRDGDLFDTVLGPALEAEAALGGPPPAQPPVGIIKAAAQGSLSAQVVEAKLGNDGIVTPENVGRGKRLWGKFIRMFKETICGEAGPYEAFNKGLLGQADLPKTIAASIVTGVLSASAVWIPLAAYGGLLLAKAGLKTYCETDDLSSP